jgi:hypothetical protein
VPFSIMMPTSSPKEGAALSHAAAGLKPGPSFCCCESLQR